MKHLVIAIIGLFSYMEVEAQVVWTIPAFPTQDDLVTLYYDVSEGNGALSGLTEPCPGCPFVYAHTGVITSASSSPSNWYHVQNPWPSSTPNNLSDANNGNVLLPYEGNVHTFNFGGLTLAEYYDLAEGEQIEQLAFVFRDALGTVVGKNSDESDIFINVSDGGFEVGFLNPAMAFNFNNVGEVVNIQAICSEWGELNLSINGITVANIEGLVLGYLLTLDNAGDYLIELTGTSTTGIISTKTVVITVLPNSPNTAWPPYGTIDGINYLNDSTVILQVFAPYKEFLFAVGDFNDWQLTSNALMNITPDHQRYWIELTNLTPEQAYRFQYHIMPDNIRVADAYAEIQLDKWNDPWIPESTYPDMIPFPTEFTSNTPVSVFVTGETEYVWTDETFERPEQENLVIYELLVRDFSEQRTYKMIEDSLDYLENLGITAIELMPVMEFNGNDSWGYNTTFYFAADKAYGTKEDLKSLVDACHERGIAVIMDIVFNHSDQPNPFITMYWNDWVVEPNNPWFNVEAPHALNWFYDWNHSSNATKEFVKRVLDHWTQDFHIDGFRWDFTQGFVQTPGGGSGYDAERIAILQDYGNHVWSQDNGIYMILEHWCAYSEEQILANDGFMLWTNNSYDYSEASMGYSSDLSNANYQSHGFNAPHAVSYMESHDEERLMYNNNNWGNSSGEYDIENFETALSRVELAACFNILLPGPKLLWQFEELGYDYSINTCLDGVTVDETCRIEAKPVRWDYFNEPYRRRLYDVFSALNHLKKDYPVFSTTDFGFDTGGFGKRLHLSSTDMNVVVLGNFHVNSINMVADFQHEGLWYDYLTGESLNITNTAVSMPFTPGEYHIYTDMLLPTPYINTPSIVEEFNNSSGSQDFELMAYPNPFTDSFTIGLPKEITGEYNIEVFDSVGKLIYSSLGNSPTLVIHGEDWRDGIYCLSLKSVNNSMSYHFSSTISKK
ncbi:MAG: 1,4-alpha-glucan-branching protein [Bacteroidetes bacterium]|nr:MAG: 1,4-alpha-glucan-branching protein [Bacteroidota bacterium]